MSWNSPVPAVLSCTSGAPSERIFNRRKAWQLLVADVDQSQRFLGDQWIFSSHHRHRLADKANFVQCDQRAIAQAIAIKRIDVFDIVASQYRHDSGMSGSFLGVNRFNARVRKGAAQDFCLEQPGEIQITGVFRLPGNFVETVDPRCLVTAYHINDC
jgi:hypothetical protein